MRADQYAFAALNTEVGIPDRNFLGDVALLPHGRAGRKRAVNRQDTDGQRIAVARDDLSQNIADEKRRLRRYCGEHIEHRRDTAGNLYFAEMGKRLVHGRVVLLDDGVAALSIRILNRLFDGSDGFVPRQHAADGEEAGLHDGVDAGAHAGFAGDFVGINHKEAEFLFQDGFLNLAGYVTPDFFGTKRRVEQERCPGFGRSKDVNAIDKLELVAGHKARAADEIGGPDGVGTETQVRDGDGTGFLRVVDKITLRVVLGSLPDDLDGVFVGADRAIRAEAIEESAHRTRIFGRELRIVGEAGVCYVVVDAHSEMILGLGLF